MTPRNRPPEDEPAQLGRKRDPSLDAKILEATLDVLSEVGGAGLTMDLVAARAGAGKATIYRRWESKSQLIVDAVDHMKQRAVDLANLPDTGTLRGDMLALFKPESSEASDRRYGIMAAFAALLFSGEPAVVAAVNAAMIEPWADAHLALMRRAVERGEIPRSADIVTLAQVVPCMAAYRTLILRKRFDREFLRSMLDGVILPALHGPPGGPEPAAKKKRR
jgi:AcrR family transcriptional regulator